MKEKIIENLIYLRLLTQYRKIFYPCMNKQKVMRTERASFLQNTSNGCYESFKIPQIETTQYSMSIMDSSDNLYNIREVVSIFCLNIKNFFKGQKVALKKPRILIKKNMDFSNEYICVIDVYIVKEGEELI